MNDDPIHGLVMNIVWDRRRAFFAEAVRRGIVTEEQVDLLLALHSERDIEQEERDRA